MPTAHFGLAIALSKQGDARQASEELRATFRADPGSGGRPFRVGQPAGSLRKICTPPPTNIRPRFACVPITCRRGRIWERCHWHWETRVELIAQLNEALCLQPDSPQGGEPGKSLGDEPTAGEVARAATTVALVLRDAPARCRLRLGGLRLTGHVLPRFGHGHRDPAILDHELRKRQVMRGRSSSRPFRIDQGQLAILGKGLAENSAQWQSATQSAGCRSIAPCRRGPGGLAAPRPRGDRKRGLESSSRSARRSTAGPRPYRARSGRSRKSTHRVLFGERQRNVLVGRVHEATVFQVQGLVDVARNSESLNVRPSRCSCSQMLLNSDW